MSACVEMFPGGRQPREGERAYAAFLAYRDLGPGRTHEATRMRLGKAPGYLKPIERWSAARDWRRRACAWDAHLQAERDKVAAEEAAKWERRRLQRWKMAGRPAGRCGPGWRRCSHRPRRRRPSPRPSRPGRSRRPSRRRCVPRGGQGGGGTPFDPVELPDGGPSGEADRRAGVGHPERGLAARREVRPADGDGRGDQGLPDPPSPLRPTAAAPNRLAPRHIASPHARPGLIGVGTALDRRDGACRGSSPLDRVAGP